MQGIVDSFSIQQRRIQRRVIRTGVGFGHTASPLGSRQLGSRHLGSRHLRSRLGSRPGARSIVPGLFALGLLATLGCSTTLAPPPSAPTPSTYRVGAPDQLLVSILPDPVIERAVTVRPDGMISIDLAGDIRAAGHTEAERQQVLTDFNATAMESLGAVAGPASAFIGFFATSVSAVLAWFVGELFDGAAIHD